MKSSDVRPPLTSISARGAQAALDELVARDVASPYDPECVEEVAGYGRLLAELARIAPFPFGVGELSVEPGDPREAVIRVGERRWTAELWDWDYVDEAFFQLVNAVLAATGARGQVCRIGGREMAGLFCLLVLAPDELAVARGAGLVVEPYEPLRMVETAGGRYEPRPWEALAPEAALVERVVARAGGDAESARGAVAAWIARVVAALRDDGRAKIGGLGNLRVRPKRRDPGERKVELKVSALLKKRLNGEPAADGPPDPSRAVAGAIVDLLVGPFDAVRLDGLGIVYRHRSAGFFVRTPTRGEVFEVPAKTTLLFRADPALDRAIAR